jgi:hypothetical protein
MRNANEMREITNKFYEAEKERLEKKLNQFVNDELEPFIMKAASNGLDRCAKSVPSDLTDAVAQLLIDNGYEVKKVHSESLNIWW